MTYQVCSSKISIVTKHVKPKSKVNEFRKDLEELKKEKMSMDQRIVAAWSVKDYDNNKDWTATVCVGEKRYQAHDVMQEIICLSSNRLLWGFAKRKGWTEDSALYPLWEDSLCELATNVAGAYDASLRGNGQKAQELMPYGAYSEGEAGNLECNYYTSASYRNELQYIVDALLQIQNLKGTVDRFYYTNSL